jgi:hypothetical protein
MRDKKVQESMSTYFEVDSDKMPVAIKACDKQFN